MLVTGPRIMFTHLHVHTEYSLLDGLSRIPQLVKATADMGMGSLAITDHGSLYGAVDFYSMALEAGVKPIIGCEIYQAKESRLVKDSSEKSPFHLTVLAQNNRGYKNLLQLVSKAHLEGFYYRPRIDDSLLEQYGEGLVVLSGCPSAQIPRLLVAGRVDEAEARARWYKELFEGRFFLEIQEHQHIPELPIINEGLIELSKLLEIPLVATNDSHYTRREEAPLQDIRICIHTNTTIHDKARLKMDDDSFYLKSPEEMTELFREFPEAIANTERIAEMCNTTLAFGELHVPSYPLPDGENPDDFLSNLCWAGLTRLYGTPTGQSEERLRYELEVIKQTRFANYFLVVWEIIEFARKNQILLSVRGSAAASLALYCLGVTEVDPLVHDLVFERFLNVERKEMPDIDMDFQDDRRDEVLNYVTHRFGKDKVAQIITFGTLGPKAAVRDVGRALGMNYAQTDKIARLLPFKIRTLNEALETVPEIRNMYQSDKTVQELIDKARGLEGIPHHVSTHAAGVVISEEPLTEYVPLQRPARGDDSSSIAMTQYPMAPIAKLGLLKMDFLGLTSLTILDRTLKLLVKTEGLKLSLNEIPHDDKKTFDLLASGQTNEVFQLESMGMQRYIRELKPSTLSDVAAMIALFRPGPMEQIPVFIDAKHGRRPVRSPHPSLDNILEDTYGVIVFQDQVLHILQTFAGYTLGEADIVRKAMGKKIAELMGKERERFLAGAKSKGFDSDVAQEVFSLIEPFAGYAFNKAHSVSYALIAYWTAYFKANHPLIYMASVLNGRREHPEKMNNAANECIRMGIPVLYPDVNRSEVEFTIDKEEEGKPGVRFGLAAIKNVGEGAVIPIVQTRGESGLFASLEDFSQRADLRGVNRRALESLAKAGTFDSLNNRGVVMRALDSILARAQLEARMRQTGQTSLFGEHPTAASPEVSNLDLDCEDISDREKTIWERELLGLSLGSNPLQLLAADPPEGCIIYRDRLGLESDGQVVTILGQVLSAQEKFTRENRRYLNTVVDLLGGSVEVIAWPQVLEKTKSVWQEGTLVWVSGKVVMRGEEMSIYCNEAEPYIEGKRGPAQSTQLQNRSGTLVARTDCQEASAPPKRTVTVALEESDNQESDAHLLQNVMETILEYPGTDRIHIEIETGRRLVKIDMPIGIGYCDDLKKTLDDLLGSGRVSVVPDAHGSQKGEGQKQLERA